MPHISNDKFYRLATLLAREEAFEQEDIVAMLHILNCDVCSARLKRSTAIVDAVDNMGLVSLLAERIDKPSDTMQNQRAVIEIVIFDAYSIMKQIELTETQWEFCAQPSIGGRRSAEKGQTIDKLQDIDSSKTFIMYDPEKKVLAIQIDGRDGKVPAVKIKMPDGSIRNVGFEKRGSVYWAEVHSLEQGEYELHLEK